MEAKPGGAGLFDIVHENRGSLNDLYEVNHDESLGEGSFSSVHSAIHRETKQQRVVKIIKRSAVRNTQRVEHEIQVLRSVDHPHIVRLVEALEDPRTVQLVCELCSGGELFDRVIDDAPLLEPVAATLFGQMARAVAYLHANCILHRDLKAENWLLAEDVPRKSHVSNLEKAVLRLADFGCARTLGLREHARTKLGSPYYIAPEVLSGFYSKPADVWSLGVNLFMFFGSRPLISGNNTEEVLSAIEVLRVNMKLDALWANLEYPVSPEGRAFLKSLLDKDPAKRPTAQEAAKDRWVAVKDMSPSPLHGRATADLEKMSRRGSSRMPQSSKPEVSAATALANVRGYRLADAKRPDPGGHLASRWERMAIAMVVAQLDRMAVRYLELLFLDLDKNRDGTLSWQELQDGFMSAGTHIDSAEARRLHEALDADGSGAVDCMEFVAAAVDDALIARESACWKAFKAFDVNASGSIERAELSRFLTGDSGKESVPAAEEAEFSELFRRLDKNSDGYIDFEEFQAFLRPLGRAGDASA